MMYFIFQCFYFMLPAYFANMAPVFFKKINFLDYPVDFNKNFNNKRIFGCHKTWRGLFFGVIAGIFTAFIQYVLLRYNFFYDLSILNYSYWFIIGFLLGFGALFGDLIKSFFKRQFNIKPGKSFFPWDQIDYSVGSLVFISIIFIPSLKMILTIIILNTCLHIIANHLAFYLNLSNVKW